MAALCLAKARSSMTAPMKWEKSVTSPIEMPSISAISWSLIFAHSDPGT